MTSGWAEPLTTRTRSGKCSPMKFAKFPERRRADLPISPPSALPSWLKNRGARCSFQCSWTSSAIRSAAAVESESAILKAPKILFSGRTAGYPWSQAQPKRSPSSVREGLAVATAGGWGVRRSLWACLWTRLLEKATVYHHLNDEGVPLGDWPWRRPWRKAGLCHVTEVAPLSTNSGAAGFSYRWGRPPVDSPARRSPGRESPARCWTSPKRWRLEPRQAGAA